MFFIGKKSFVLSNFKILTTETVSYPLQFRCDKSELKEVLELAGKVLVCSVITISSKYANIMYSHPLEAVQVK